MDVSSDGDADFGASVAYRKAEKEGGEKKKEEGEYRERTKIKRERRVRHSTASTGVRGLGAVAIYAAVDSTWRRVDRRGMSLGVSLYQIPRVSVKFLGRPTILYRRNHPTARRITGRP